MSRIPEPDKSIDLMVEVFDEAYRVQLIYEHKPPTSPGHTFRVFDRRHNEVTMLDDRLLPVLEETRSTLNQMTATELPQPERFIWESLLDGGIRLQRSFDEYRRYAWFTNLATNGTPTTVVEHLSAKSAPAQRPQTRREILLSSFFPADTVDAMLGDMDEQYAGDLASAGRLHAVSRYLWQFLRSVAFKIFRA